MWRTSALQTVGSRDRERHEGESCLLESRVGVMDTNGTELPRGVNARFISAVQELHVFVI